MQTSDNLLIHIKYPQTFLCKCARNMNINTIYLGRLLVVERYVIEREDEELSVEQTYKEGATTERWEIS